MPLSYAVGDIVTYLAFGEERRRVLVTAKCASMRPGKGPGFDGTIVGSSMPVWGYDHQVIEVLPQARNERSIRA